MDPDALIGGVRDLRARGLTPRAIAKALGITRGEADALIRRIARESTPAEAAVVGAWVSSGWSRGLRWSDHLGWKDDASGDGLPGLVSVLVVREHRYGRVSACAYLVDAQCLGIKDVLGPRVLDRTELNAFVARLFAAYNGAPVQAPLELARELVFGAEAYARTLGFEPHRDFASCRGHLGTWSGPSSIGFGLDGKPFFMQGPHDDALSVIETLEQTVGSENFHFVAVEPRADTEAAGGGGERSLRRRRLADAPER